MERNSDILLVGSGHMAMEYLKVLEALKKNVHIVGRGKSNIEIIKKKYPQYSFQSGGIENYLALKNRIPGFVINAVNIKELGKTTMLLLENGAKNILVEKPGDTSLERLKIIQKKINKCKAKVFIAYNRRFYASVLSLIKKAEQDGGIRSLTFEFTEWTHTFNEKTHDISSLNRWILANSSHVLDTAFFLIGKPKTINCNIFGKNEISWHKSGSIFSGNGISNKNIPFSYSTDWNSSGRWAIEITTNKKRYYLRPMEELYEQRKGAIN